MSAEKLKDKKQKMTIKELVSLNEKRIFSAKTYVEMAIYSILELPHEAYYGSHSEKNINILEKVTIRTYMYEGDMQPVDIVKPYLSPTKQRGIERRAIAYSKVKTSDGRIEPYYKYFGLSIDITNTYKDGVPDPRDILTYLWGAVWTKPAARLMGRIHYGGGVAVQGDKGGKSKVIQSKIRNRVEYSIYDAVRGDTSQTLFNKEYAEPHVLFPVYRVGTLLGVENYEPHAMAYAFLNGLPKIGSGTNKGITILEAKWLRDAPEKVLVVDVAGNLMPDPVVISPLILSDVEAVLEFRRKTLRHSLYDNPDNVFRKALNDGPVRLAGDTAYQFLRRLAWDFEKNYLERIDTADIPRVKVTG